MNKNFSANKGEWSELYVFLKLLKDGKLYLADTKLNKISDKFLEIVKIIRGNINYFTGDEIRIFCNNEYYMSISLEKLDFFSKKIFENISKSKQDDTGAFKILDISDFLNEIKVDNIKAPSKDKVDILMEIIDKTSVINIDKISGFSIKSDIGSSPTLINASKNTRFKYEIFGISDSDMNDINKIDRASNIEYMKSRFKELFSRASYVKYDSMFSDVYNENLLMIDSKFPEIYAYFILFHFMTMGIYNLDCNNLCELLQYINPLDLKKWLYKDRLKDMFVASALGMTPGKLWNKINAVTGGYIVVKRDGEVVCFHLYNRHLFMDYLLNNTIIDRPSASRHDYAYIFKEGNRYFINLNIQIRFKKINNLENSINNDLIKKEKVFDFMKKYYNKIKDKYNL